VNIFNDGRMWEQKKVYHRNTLWKFDPNIFAALTDLEEINMSFLDMIGWINGDMINNCPKLKYINLSNNRLIRELPQTANWETLTNLRIIELNDNHISGAVPSSWQKLKNLEYVTVANTLMGDGIYEIPILYAAQQLRAIDFSACRFVGRFPKEYLESN